MTEHFILSDLDADVGECINTSRRELFRRPAATLIAASVPLALAAASPQAFAAGGLPKQVVDVLNFALTLEYLEAAFYKQGNSSRGLIPSKYRSLFKTIGAHATAPQKL